MGGLAGRSAVGICGGDNWRTHPRMVLSNLVTAIRSDGSSAGFFTEAAQRPELGMRQLGSSPPAAYH
jgi:hypothetical protein